LYGDLTCVLFHRRRLAGPAASSARGRQWGVSIPRPTRCVGVL